MEYQTEYFTGADLTGSSGDANRVLTLGNSGTTTGDEFLIYANGLALSLTTEYTVVHADTGTKITFLNKLWDDQLIISTYVQARPGVVATGTTEYESMRADIQAIISEHGTTVTLSRPTETTGSMGDVTLVSEEDYIIYAMIQDITKKDRKIENMGLAIPGNSKVFFYHEYPDSITGNGNVEVEAGDKITDVDGTVWRVEQIIGERHASRKEIFRVGVINKIDLNQ